MIVVTGAAGFIGSCLAQHFKRLGKQVVLVDQFDRTDKMQNLKGFETSAKIERSRFFDWFDGNHQKIEAVYHYGARTDTTEFDLAIFDELNLEYSKQVWGQCTHYEVPLIYASSAATYGSGESGFDDDLTSIDGLNPLNPYGDSKQQFDLWVLEQTETPPKWAGLKFFNVYGPNEFHKGRMASVIFHAFNQIEDSGELKLFRSHRPDFKDGEQLRDFIYVKDVLKVSDWLLHNDFKNDIYNLGTGTARTFLDLGRSVFHALNFDPAIEFIDTPEDIRDKYQYFTEAKMSKLRSQGYENAFHSLEEGVQDYVQNYLVPRQHF